MKKNIAVLTILTFFLNSLCYGQDTYTYSQPKELGDGWKTANLESQNVDTTLIYKAFSQLRNKPNEIHSVLLIKNDRLIIEEYFKEHSANQLHDLRSATKSIRSILLGIAIDNGFIEDINDPISKYLKSTIPKKNLDKRKNNITIKNLPKRSTPLIKRHQNSIELLTYCHH